MAEPVAPMAKEREAPFVVPPRPLPTPDQLRVAARAFARVGRRKSRPDDLGARDEAFIEDVLPPLDALYDRYFRCETEVEGDLPTGPFLAVANHNGMTGTPDMFCHMAAFWRLQTPRRLAYGLMHDMPFHLPVAGAWLNACGAVAANPMNARAALSRGAAVLVFPGGDYDACKPFSARYEVRFGQRRGFIRLALSEGVPIVPIVSVGAHESLYLLTDGQWFAEKSGLKKYFRSNVAPLGVAMPWGIIAGLAIPHLPPPVKIHTRFCKPIDLKTLSNGRVGPQAAADDELVERCFHRVWSSMQSVMDELRAAGRHGLFPRSAR
ncbi:MAG: 1-acyl-sn-glycerol-3-phosphate acyltransferase [Polyangiaceae bacterium]